jgi:hypothetical protein
MVYSASLTSFQAVLHQSCSHLIAGSSLEVADSFADFHWFSLVGCSLEVADSFADFHWFSLVGCSLEVAESFAE